MLSYRSALLTLSCSVALLPCSIACSGSTRDGGSGGASGQGTGGASVAAGGASGTTVGIGGGTASGGSSNHGGAATGGAAMGGTAMGGAATGGAATGGAAMGGAATGGAATGGAAMGGAAMGGAAMGGAAMGGAAMGGAAGQGGGAGGGGGCSGLSQTRSSRTAVSSGFSGSYATNYYPLYSHACANLADCSAACVSAGGTQASCAASECIVSAPNYCLPPTYWFDLNRLLVEGNTIDSSAWIIMVNNPYQDQLVATNFQFEIPTAAKIKGIVFSFNESADADAAIADFSVRAFTNGAAVGLDRAHTTAWTTSFHYEDYGSPIDLWGTTWTAATIDASGFGVALTPMYLMSAGNERAYVDFIRATVYYDTCQ